MTDKERQEVNDFRMGVKMAAASHGSKVSKEEMYRAVLQFRAIFHNVPMMHELDIITDTEDILWYELDGDADNRKGPFKDFSDLVNHLKDEITEYPISCLATDNKEPI